MTELIVLSFLGLFYADNHELIKRVKDDMAKGYTWEYVGYTEWDEEKSPSLIIGIVTGKRKHN